MGHDLVRVVRAVLSLACGSNVQCVLGCHSARAGQLTCVVCKVPIGGDVEALTQAAEWLLQSTTRLHHPTGAKFDFLQHRHTYVHPLLARAALVALLHSTAS
eukprot:2025716-Amphidinium_carterae.1